MKKAPRVLLLIDWLPERGSLLLDSLRKAGLDCDIMGTDFDQSRWTPVNKVVSHWPRCLWVSLKAFCRRNRYDYVIAWQQTMGTFLGLLKLITFAKRPRVFILTAIVVERRNRLMEWLRKKIISLSWKKVNRIGFLSNANMRFIQGRFNVNKSKAVHLPLPITMEKIPHFSGFKEGSYVYSVGRSYRDYETLMAAARACPHKFVVATSDAAIKGLAIPENVIVYRGVFGDEADHLMEEAAAVVIPLCRVNSPSGELSLLEAMCYGKPVIITGTLITKEYIMHGKNGFLIPWKEPEAIVEAVNAVFADPEKADAMGRMARKTVMENHTVDVFARKVLDAIMNDVQGVEAS